MTTANWLVIAILFIALILFVREKPRVDVVALLVLVACVLTGLVDPRDAFLGFADPAVVTVWAVFILSGGITKTGVAEQIGNLMTHFAGESPKRILLVMMLLTATMSAFMNNIGAVATMLPAVTGICRKLRIPPSKMMIPLAVSGLLGGNITLIGTPPNLIASAMMAQAGIEPFRFFDYAPTGLLVTLLGLAYMFTVGYFLLPAHTTGDSPAEAYQIPEDFLTQVVITDQSPLVNQRINEVRFGLENDVAIVYARRGDDFVQQASDRRLRVDDVLLIEGPFGQVEAIAEKMALQLPKRHQQDEVEAELEAAGDLVEITLSPRSRYRGQTLSEVGFRPRYGISVLAVRHEGEPTASNVADVRLRFGDVLLAQGASRRIDDLKLNSNFIVLDNEKQRRGIRREKAKIAMLVMAVTLISLAFVPSPYISTTMLLGAIVMVLSGALTMEEAYESIDWKSVFLIAGMLPIGAAMDSTGTAAMLANGVIDSIGRFGPTLVMAALFVLTAILTSIISNAAATVLIIPIAIGAAQGLQIDPRPFVMTTVIAASSAFLLPIGHQANIIIYGVGGYRFTDFVRVGGLLTLMLLVAVVLAVPLIWPF